MIQGTEVFTILADQIKLSEILSVLPQFDIINIIKGQSSVILISPKDIINVEGVIAYLTHIIASNQINITQIMSCHPDTIFLIEKNDATEAYKAIQKKIYLLRELIELD
ncbi:MAG: ACT domain-containing protein [Promethearchaeota archaeon]